MMTLQIGFLETNNYSREAKGQMARRKLELGTRKLVNTRKCACASREWRHECLATPHGPGYQAVPGFKKSCNLIVEQFSYKFTFISL